MQWPNKSARHRMSTPRLYFLVNSSATTSHLSRPLLVQVGEYRIIQRVHNRLALPCGLHSGYIYQRYHIHQAYPSGRLMEPSGISIWDMGIHLGYPFPARNTQVVIPDGHFRRVSTSHMDIHTPDRYPYPRRISTCQTNVTSRMDTPYGSDVPGE